MSKTQSTYRSSITTLWPWVGGAFLVGCAASIVMPPLLLVLIVGLTAWVLVKRGHQAPLSRVVIAVDLGLGMATVLFLIIWIAGNIAR
jgi:energy-coupling factor transporter transmembrane protein EcfT